MWRLSWSRRQVGFRNGNGAVWDGGSRYWDEDGMGSGDRIRAGVGLEAMNALVHFGCGAGLGVGVKVDSELECGDRDTFRVMARKLGTGKAAQIPASPGREGPTAAAGAAAAWAQGAPCSGHLPSSPAGSIPWPG